MWEDVFIEVVILHANYPNETPGNHIMHNRRLRQSLGCGGDTIVVLLALPSQRVGVVVVGKGQSGFKWLRYR